MNEYEIRQQALAFQNLLVENHGEITEEQIAKLDAILEDLEEPMSYLFYAQERLRSAAEELAELITIYTRQKKSIDRQRDYFKSRMQQLLELKQELGDEPKVKKPWGIAYLRSSTKVVITDLESVPEDFVKVTRSAKTQEIAKILKQGIELTGTELQTNQSISIRTK